MDDDYNFGTIVRLYLIFLALLMKIMLRFADGET